MCAQTRPQFILSSEKVYEMESEPMLTPKGKSSLLEAQKRVEPTTLHHAEQPEPMLTPREKSPLPEGQRRVEPAALHHAGQTAQHTTS